MKLIQNLPARVNILLSMLAPLLGAAVLVSCHGKQELAKALPGNITAHPVGTVGIIAPRSETDIYDAMKALGIPFVSIPVDSLRKVDRYSESFLLLDEDALEDKRVFVAYPSLLEYVRSGKVLIMLHQRPSTVAKLISGSSVIGVRDVEYTVTLLQPHSERVSLAGPNVLDKSELESLSASTHQLAHGSSTGVALIAANRQAPDSSAALLFQPAGSGAIWYVGFPIASRVAIGFSAEQKILANIVSISAK